MKIDNTDFDVETVKSMSKDNFCKAFKFLYKTEKRLAEIYAILTDPPENNATNVD